MENEMTWDIDVDATPREVYIRQRVGEGRPVFIARFAYANPKRSATHFIKFLKENFTPEEYFEHFKKLPPASILKLKGFKSYNEIVGCKS
jgi:hypothetical protein